MGILALLPVRGGCPLRSPQDAVPGDLLPLSETPAELTDVVAGRCEECFAVSPDLGHDGVLPGLGSLVWFNHLQPFP